MLKEIRHTGLVVRNLEDALYFWHELLGFKIERRADESGPYIDRMLNLKDARVTTVKMSAPGGGMIELLHFHSHPDISKWNGKPYSTGLTHIAFTVDNLDESCKKLKSAGVIFFSEPQYSLDQTVKVTYCEGPEGLLLELVEILNT